MSRPIIAERVATVVVVDDTPDLRLLLRMVLELSERYTVIAEAGDGVAGIEAVRQWQPDVVLLDLAMPVMDGLEALPGIRAACPTAAVIVLSGFEADRMADQALAQGASAYVQKGTHPDDVLTALDGVLGRDFAMAPSEAPAAAASTDDPSDEVEALRSAFATAAHELRTPATVLIGLAQTLTKRREQLDAERSDQLLDAIVRQTRVLDRVTADLLTSAQATRGGLSATPEEMDLVPALRAAALSVADSATVAIDAPDVVEVFADPVRAQQMLTNLLSNALKYGAPPLSITIAHAGSQVEVRIDDRGPGVPEEFRDHLFKQYSRAEGARAAGTGLGLFVVRALAEAQGGRAWYEPGIDGGSSFRFTLPVR